MSHGVLVQEKVAALNIDAYNRSVVSASAVDNGNVFNLLTRSATGSSGCEVWVATYPVTGSLTGLWMAYEPEVVKTVSGTQEFKGIDPDPRNFYNIAGDVFSAFKPKVGDILTMSVDDLDSATVAAYAVAVNASYKLNWGANSVAGLSLKFLGLSYFSIGTGSIGTQRVTAYKFEVVTE